MPLALQAAAAGAAVAPPQASPGSSSSSSRHLLGRLHGCAGLALHGARLALTFRATTAAGHPAAGLTLMQAARLGPLLIAGVAGGPSAGGSSMC